MVRSGGIFGQGGNGTLGGKAGFGAATTTPAASVLPGLPDLSQLSVILKPTSGVPNPLAAAAQNALRYFGAPDAGSTKADGKGGRVYAPSQPPDGLWGDCSQMALDKIRGQTPALDFIHSILGLDKFGVPKTNVQTWKDPSHPTMYCNSPEGKNTDPTAAAQAGQCWQAQAAGPLSIMAALQQIPPASICDTLVPQLAPGTLAYNSLDHECACNYGVDLSKLGSACPVCNPPGAKPSVTPTAPGVTIKPFVQPKNVASLFAPTAAAHPAPVTQTPNLSAMNLSGGGSPGQPEVDISIGKLNRGLNAQGLKNLAPTATQASVLGSSSGAIWVVLLLLAAGGGGYYWYKKRQEKALGGAI